MGQHFKQPGRFMSYPPTITALLLARLWRVHQKQTEETMKHSQAVNIFIPETIYQETVEIKLRPVFASCAPFLLQCKGTKHFMWPSAAQMHHIPISWREDLIPTRNWWWTIAFRAINFREICQLDYGNLIDSFLVPEHNIFRTKSRGSLAGMNTCLQLKRAHDRVLVTSRSEIGIPNPWVFSVDSIGRGYQFQDFSYLKACRTPLGAPLQVDHLALMSEKHHHEDDDNQHSLAVWLT